MYAAIDLHQPQQVIHLGDVMDDAEEVAGHYPALPFCLVPGNCDGWWEIGRASCRERV